MPLRIRSFSGQNAVHHGVANSSVQGANGNFFGDVFIYFRDSQAQAILQFLQLDADTLPIFVTDNVTAEALGYHTSYAIQNGENGTRLRTFIYTSWLDPALVDPLFGFASRCTPPMIRISQ